MYANKDDLVQRYGEKEIIQLTDRDRAGVIDDVVLDRAILDASARIDGYLAAYLPLTTVPAALIRVCCDIAHYYLYDFAPARPEAVRDKFEEAIKYLTAVGKGQISLSSDNPGAAVKDKQLGLPMFTGGTGQSVADGWV